MSSCIWKLALTQVISLILLVGDDWPSILQYEPADWSICSSLSAVGLATSSFWCDKRVVLHQYMWVLLIGRCWGSWGAIAVRVTYLVQAALSGTGEGVESSLLSEDESLVNILINSCILTMSGLRVEVVLYAVALWTILVVCLDAQKEFFCSDVSNSAVELRSDNQVWCWRCYFASCTAWYKTASILWFPFFSTTHPVCAHFEVCKVILTSKLT